MPDFEYTVFPVRKRVIKVTLTNNQSTATANPHDQLIMISHDYLLALLGVGIDPYMVPLNTIFYDPQANAQAYSWYGLFDGTYHYWFVKTQSIGANSTYTLYMIIDLTKQLIDGNIAGISAYYGNAYLGLPYGQYDNGANVFINYWNFAGTSLPSGWTGSGYTVNNGLSLPYSSYAITTTNYGLNSSQILDIFGYWNKASSNSNALFGYNNGESALGSSGVYAVAFAINTGILSNGDVTFVSDNGQSGSSGTAYTLSGADFGYGYLLLSIYWPSTSQACAYKNYKQVTCITTTLPSQQIPIGGANNQSSQSTIGPFYWVLLRDYPPNGVMPAVSFSLLD
jgi:hypothetical protein